MEYIIDGYNVLYQSDFDNRHDLLAEIADFCQRKNKTARVVFDGYAESPFVSTRVSVLFTGDADQFIKDFLGNIQNASACLLVSSDKELQTVAGRQKVRVLSAEDFINICQREISFENESRDCSLSDIDIEKQLKEFNYFKKE